MPDIETFFWAAGITILQGYGLTETSPLCAVNLPTAFRIGSVGRERSRPPGGQAQHTQQVAAALERHADKRPHSGIRQSHIGLVLAHVVNLGGSTRRGYPAGDAKTDRKP